MGKIYKNKVRKLKSAMLKTASLQNLHDFRMKRCLNLKSLIIQFCYVHWL